MKVIADNSIPFLKGRLEPVAEIEYLPSSDFIPEKVKDADILVVRSIDKCSRKLLQHSRVKLITTATIGYDHIDTTFCESAGINWRNAPGCNASSVAQYILSSLVTLAIRNDTSLKGKTIGIIGVGHVGTQAEKLCRAFGLNVLLNDPPREKQEKRPGTFSDLKTLAAVCDIITLHTPLTREGSFPTYHLANDSFFNSLQKKPWFINSSRGSVHETDAVIRAKKKGLISELVIDCWENEPDISRELLELCSLATPHIAGFSADGKSNATRMCLEVIRDEYGLNLPGLEGITPEAPQEPVIDLDLFPRESRIEHAILHTFNPGNINHLLKEKPEKFEWLRTYYDHPREFKAYTVIHALPKEDKIISGLGFNSL